MNVCATGFYLFYCILLRKLSNMTVLVQFFAVFGTRRSKPREELPRFGCHVVGRVPEMVFLKEYGLSGFFVGFEPSWLSPSVFFLDFLGLFLKTSHLSKRVAAQNTWKSSALYQAKPQKNFNSCLG
jgi:hypothetical protein